MNILSKYHKKRHSSVFDKENSDEHLLQFNEGRIINANFVVSPRQRICNKQTTYFGG
jgi:hypothetical protein